MAEKRALGKGLDAMIPDMAPVKNKTTGKFSLINPNDIIQNLDIEKVTPDKNQPRKAFDEDKLYELADTIKAHGIITPLTVREKDDYYVIIAGERRWRAAKIAGLKNIPCCVRNNLTDSEITILQLIENEQREDLNPLEVAEAYRIMMDQYEMKQDAVAETVGKNRTTVANMLRLLNLSDEAKQMLRDGKLSMGHARALLALEDKDEQANIAMQVFDQQMSVRETEKLINTLKKPKKPKRVTPEAIQLIYRQLEDKLREKIGAKVTIKSADNKKGYIEIDFFSQSELETITDTILK